MRMMATIIVAELLFLALVYFWPGQVDPSTRPINFRAEEETQIRAPVITEQQSSPPPPPAPSVPIPVPNDQPVQEEIKFPKNLASDSQDTLSLTVGKGGNESGPVVGNPQVGPRVIKIEEPSFENNTPQKADIYVRMLVNTSGLVDSASIQKVVITDPNGTQTQDVRILKKYINDRVIKAALNWRFHPAKDKGRPVRAYTTQIFTVDY